MWLGLLLWLGFLMPANNPDDKIAASLLEKGMDGTEQGFLIMLHHQVDLSGLAKVKGKEAKALAGWDLLTKATRQGQPEVIYLLEKHHAPVKAFTIVNMVWSFGDLNLMRAVAALPSVAYVAADSPLRMEEVEVSEQGILRDFEEVTWGISKIQADSVWAMGFTGSGIVVGGQDTGYEWEHPALIHSYRGWDGTTADHNYNWHDAIYELDPLHNDQTQEPTNNPCGLQSVVPCDDNNHGTHTMGTMTGIDSTNQIGIAPDAKWIGCRNMERGWGKPSTYIECFEWFMAPTDLNHENPDPAKAPHVIANSWGCPPIEGCDPSNFGIMELVVNNLKATGVVVVVSAGNNGSGCSTINNPAAIFEASFSVGATRDDDELAGFSSRGPVTVDGSGRMKPEVSAPGVGVRSAIRNGSYASFSGTSMAGPHVAGAVALILSARPDLSGEVDVIQDILMQTADFIVSEDTCGNVAGSERPNNTFGWGRINVFNAVKAALELVSVEQPMNDGIKPTVYPNPFRDVIHIDKLKGTSGRFSLMDMNGKIVFQRDLPAAGPLYMMPVSGIADAPYIYIIEQDGQRYTGVLTKI